VLLLRPPHLTIVICPTRHHHHHHHHVRFQQGCWRAWTGTTRTPSSSPRPWPTTPSSLSSSPPAVRTPLFIITGHHHQHRQASSWSSFDLAFTC
jgi:hypothetical protein